MKNMFRKSDKLAQFGHGAVMCLLMLCATLAHSASKTVLVLGDSLSAEYGLVRGSGWVPLLEKRLKSENIDAAVVNASISGETTSGGRARLPALLDEYHPAIVVIELGANDGLRGLPLQTVEANLRAIIADAQKAKAKVVLVGMQIPPNYGRAYTGQFSGLYARLGKEANVTLVPFLLEGVADKPQLFQADHLHPIADAQPTLLNNIWPYLKPMVSK